MFSISIAAVKKHKAHVQPPQSTGLPSRNYSWPPFEKGNLAAVSHGATSHRIVSPIAVELAGVSKETVEWLNRPEFEPAVVAWAFAEARCQLLRAYLEEHGYLENDGKPRPATTLLLQSEKQAASLRNDLGLTPTSYSKIQQALASGAKDAAIADHMAEGRRLRLEHEQARPHGGAP